LNGYKKHFAPFAMAKAKSFTALLLWCVLVHVWGNDSCADEACPAHFGDVLGGDETSFLQARASSSGSESAMSDIAMSDAWVRGGRVGAAGKRGAVAVEGPYGGSAKAYGAKGGIGGKSKGVAALQDVPSVRVERPNGGSVSVAGRGGVSVGGRNGGSVSVRPAQGGAGSGGVTVHGPNGGTVTAHRAQGEARRGGVSVERPNGGSFSAEGRGGVSVGVRNGASVSVHRAQGGARRGGVSVEGPNGGSVSAHGAQDGA